MRMVSAVVLGIICGVTGVVVATVIVVICRMYKRKYRHRTCVPPCGYDAVGDYKPPSLMSISSGSQDVQLTKEHRAIQPRSTSITSRASISTMSRGSIRSDTLTEETSSISARSDTSVDSCIFDPSFGAIRPDLYPRKDAVLQQSSVDQNLGRLHIRLKYDFRTSDVIIHLIEAQDLISTDQKDLEGGSFGDPYVRLAILPEVDERIRQSSVKRKTCNPFYNEYFKFPLTIDDVRDKTLVFHIYDYDKFSRHKIIGEVQVDLRKVDVTNSVEMWCDINRHHKCTGGDYGEVLLSLSYLPTAERLTVVVMKAKELRMTNVGGSSDAYIRVSLTVEGKKVKRKKTTVKRNTTCPVWNEALAFNVPAELLPKVSLEVAVMDHHDLIGHGDIVGRCIIGPDKDGQEGKHWNDMMQNHRKSMAMWHHLHKR